MGASAGRGSPKFDGVAFHRGKEAIAKRRKETSENYVVVEGEVVIPPTVTGVEAGKR